uniref:Uncharacterized protein TCIL3000_11_9030 n=1 Tax=Trypanosoma congolense (strain IL3000) TaxID=1068625 RepID=G0V1C4_TRYCI|nr:unnamed protein product [Trypanosoma congolense IL3000]
MWRHGYSLHGLPPMEGLMAAPGSAAPPPFSLRCKHASIIKQTHEGGDNCDIALLSSMHSDGGRLLSLHIDSERAEIREAWPGRADVSEVSEVEEGGNRRYTPLIMTPWRCVDTTVVVEDDYRETLQRVRLYNEYESTATALSLDTLYQLQLDPLRSVNCFDINQADVNATAMDYWGPHCVVVGFSSGKLHVVDWRDAGGGVLMNTALPQFPQNRLPRHRYGAALNPQYVGIMSCCALVDSFRVVCGLGDCSGTVVVADLRKAATGSMKRGRSARPKLVDRERCAVLSGSFSAPTSYPMCDMRHCTGKFGTIAMVDTGGTAVMTTISTLESSALNVRRQHSSALNGDWSPTCRNPPINECVTKHTSKLRCDVAADGSFMVNTSGGCSSVSLKAYGDESLGLDLGELARGGLKDEVFTSVACIGSVVCAQMKSGSVVYAAINVTNHNGKDLG